MSGIKKNIFWKTLQAGADAGFQFLGIILVATLIPKKEFGHVALVLAYVVFSYLVFDFGISKAIARYSAGVKATKKGRNFVKRSFKISLFISMVSLFLWYSFFYLLYKGDFKTLFLLGGIGIGARVLQNTADSILQGYEYFKFLFLNSFITRAIGLLFLYIGAKYYSAIGAVLFLGVNPIIVSIAPWIMAFKLDDSEEGTLWPDFKELFKFAFPLGVAGVMGFFYTKVDIPIIKMFWPATEVAKYEIADRIFQAPLIFCSVLAISISPISSKLFFLGKQKELKKTAIKAGFYGFAISVPLFTLLFFFAGEIIKLILPSYQDAYSIIRILAPLIIIKALASSILGGVLVPAGHPWVLAFLASFGGGLNVLLDFVFIPYFGGVGAAVSTLIGHTIAGALSFLFCFKLLFSEKKEKKHEKEKDRKDSFGLPEPDETSFCFRQDNIYSKGTSSTSSPWDALCGSIHEKECGDHRQQD